MISHPRWKAFAAAWLLLLLVVPPTLPGAYARSASRNLRYFLHSNGHVGGSAGLRNLRKSTNRRALPAPMLNGENLHGSTGQQIRSIFSLMDVKRSVGQHRLLPGSKESKGSKGSKGKGKGKGASKKCKSGKGKGKGSKKESCDELPDFCDRLDFRTGVWQVPPPEAYGDSVPHHSKSSKQHRGLTALQERGLQFKGPMCDTNVLDTARHIPNLSIFVSLIEQAGLEDIFLCAGPFTVLSPTNAAFAANPGLTTYLADLHNVEQLREVVLYHILPGLYLTDDFQNGTIGTLQGEAVTVNVTSSLITFNGAGLVEGDILACNGVLQLIDEVLLPPGKYLAGCDERYFFTLQRLTFALDTLYQGLNILPEVCDSLDYGGMTQGALCEPNVLDTAKRFHELSTFVQLVELAGLQDIFICAGPFTLLAPSNSAFDSIDPEVIRELLHPSNSEKLQDLLLYHIVPGLYLPAELEAGDLETLLVDQTVEVTLDPIMFNQKAGVVHDNVVACNGAIYILDDVLDDVVIPGK